MIYTVLVEGLSLNTMHLPHPLYGNIKVKIGISLVIYPFSDLLDSVCTILWHLSPENGHLNEWSGTSLLQNILGQSIHMQYIGEVGIKQLVVDLVMKEV